MTATPLRHCAVLTIVPQRFSEKDPAVGMIWCQWRGEGGREGGVGVCDALIGIKKKKKKEKSGIREST